MIIYNRLCGWVKLAPNAITLCHGSGPRRNPWRTTFTFALRPYPRSVSMTPSWRLLAGVRIPFRPHQSSCLT
jgi:hypothetical protein